MEQKVLSVLAQLSNAVLAVVVLAVLVIVGVLVLVVAVIVLAALTHWAVLATPVEISVTFL